PLLASDQAYEQRQHAALHPVVQRHRTQRLAWQTTQRLLRRLLSRRTLARQKGQPVDRAVALSPGRAAMARESPCIRFRRSTAHTLTSPLVLAPLRLERPYERLMRRSDFSSGGS